MTPTQESTETRNATIDSSARTSSETGLRRYGRFTFKIGSITFIAIGALHTWTQATSLAAAGIRSDLEAIGIVEGIDAQAWDLWQGIGFLMGLFSMALGLSNLAGLQGRIDDYPAVGVCAVNVAMLAGITAIGAVYLGPIQLVGGPIGIVLFTVPILAQLTR